MESGYIPANMESPARVNVLGVGISAINLESAVETLVASLREGRRGYVCVTGVHGVIESQSDDALRRIHNRSLLTTPDGMPMVWMGKLAGRRDMSRVYGPDLMERVMAWSAVNGATHYFYGGNTGVADLLSERLQNRFPGLKVAGTYTPPFGPLPAEEEERLRRQLDELQPDFFWVGLSTPKQERFMAAYIDRFPVKIMLGVGAAFDFHAGRVQQAPRWIQRSGFEWLYRLIQEPRRLWKRYLRNNPLFVWKVGGQLSGLRKYTVDG
jgi:N-acetylglucosaminyldiphosphoundecaprenol N-acetyl-beta-D-mannosaminyltransferase